VAIERSRSIAGATGSRSNGSRWSVGKLALEEVVVDVGRKPRRRPDPDLLDVPRGACRLGLSST
jgi:hypothetical protein